MYAMTASIICHTSAGVSTCRARRCRGGGSGAGEVVVIGAKGQRQRGRVAQTHVVLGDSLMDVVVIRVTAVVDDTVHIQVQVVCEAGESQVSSTKKEGRGRGLCDAARVNRSARVNPKRTVLRDDRDTLRQDLVDQRPSL